MHINLANCYGITNLLLQKFTFTEKKADLFTKLLYYENVESYILITTSMGHIL